MATTSQPGPGSECIVVLSDLGSGMLKELVINALQRTGRVQLYEAQPPPSVEPDLIIERVEGLEPDETPTLRFSESGRSQFTLSIDQLDESALTLVINAVISQDRPWLEAVLEACRRIDSLIDSATELAATIYSNGEDFIDWRGAFAADRTLNGGREDRDPLASQLAQPSDPAQPFLHSLGSSRFLGRSETIHPPDHPFVRLVDYYGLTGQHIDIILLCFVNELDPRYGDRLAYIQQDPARTDPSIDLVTTLLASSAADRLALQRDFYHGPLVTNGIVTLTRPHAEAPLRTATLSLDASTTQILLGDDEPTPTHHLHPAGEGVRSSAYYQPSPLTVQGAEAVAGGQSVHIVGPSLALRRSAALDLATALETDLVIVAPDELGLSHDRNGDPLALERLRRELFRLDAVAYTETTDRAAIASLGSALITGSTEPVIAPSVHNLTAQPPQGTERTRIWETAARWANVELEGGLDPLVERYGVDLDTAVDALLAAESQAGGQPKATEVQAVLSQSATDDAGGLLTTAHPRFNLDDLVLDPTTRRQLDYATARIRNRDEVVTNRGWDQRSSRLTGTYLLFAGPSGTGKTSAAEAIANHLGLPAQFLELSALLSRWVGDFEKAVDKVFAAAEATGGIVIINEADAVLAPRTETDSAQARYANAGISHLLSRLEQFQGHVIFTTNLMGADSIDPAFHRRLTATIRFRLPDRDQRLAIWRTVWPTATRDGRPLHYTIDGASLQRSNLLTQLAAHHPLSGGSIANIARTATFMASERQRQRTNVAGGVAGHLNIDQASLDEALRMELEKIGDFRLLMVTKTGAAS